MIFFAISLMHSKRYSFADANELNGATWGARQCGKKSIKENFFRFFHSLLVRETFNSHDARQRWDSILLSSLQSTAGDYFLSPIRCYVKGVSVLFCIEIHLPVFCRSDQSHQATSKYDEKYSFHFSHDNSSIDLTANPWNKFQIFMG